MGRTRRARRSRATSAGVLLALSVLAGCASGPLVAFDGGFRHVRHGYRLGAPPSSAPPWECVELEGSVLAYRRPGPLRMTLASRCRVPLGTPRIMARHLRIGIPHHVVRHAGPVEVAGLPGWEQVFDASDDGVVVRVKTVTFVVNGCVLDWVLSARDGRGFETAEPDFDAWWGTLRADPPAAATTAGADPGAP